MGAALGQTSFILGIRRKTLSNMPFFGNYFLQLSFRLLAYLLGSHTAITKWNVWTEIVGQNNNKSTGEFEDSYLRRARRRWRVNTHIVELSTQLLVFEPNITLAYAREVLGYPKNLGNPVTRLYITHYHPDHPLRAAAFSVPMYALSEVLFNFRGYRNVFLSCARDKLTTS
jgi:hypothetical protein